MSFFGMSRKPLSRRSLLKSVGYFSTASVVMKPGLVLASAAVDVTAAPFNASSNLPDNSAAFQAALNLIASNGGGRLYVPDGNYVLQSPLIYSGNSLTITGDGEGGSSVLINTHSGTVLTVHFNDTSRCLIVRDLGFSPCSGGLAQGAISVIVPPLPSGWPNVVIEDVNIGVPGGENNTQYTAYQQAITLTNTNRAHISNVNTHGNVLGEIAIALEGTCYDTRVLGCTLEGYAYGIVLFSYCEGLHLTNNVIICSTAVYTGAENYNQGNVPINLLELFMSECELNTQLECLFLYQVKNAQISNCHFTGPRGANGGAAIDMRGCSESMISNSTFCNSWSPGGTAMTGIAFLPSSLVPTSNCHVSDVQFENTTFGIYFGAGAQANTACNVGLLTYGTGSLVNGSAVYGDQTQQVYVDVSGNSSNNASWLTSTNMISAVTGRRTNSEN